MKLIDGLNLKGRPVEIPDSSRDDFPQFFVDMGFKVGAEIGVEKGEFSEKICKVGLELYAIDPWSAYHGAGRSGLDQTKQDSLYNLSVQVLSPYANCKIIRKTSMDAVKDFKAESLDFVYIDGNHCFRYVSEDIYEWFWKVKKGGIISGHDYHFTFMGANNGASHVGPVVDAFIKAMGIDNFYVFASEISTGSNRCFNWMIVK